MLLRVSQCETEAISSEYKIHEHVTMKCKKYNKILERIFFSIRVLITFIILLARNHLSIRSYFRWWIIDERSRLSFRPLVTDEMSKNKQIQCKCTFRPQFSFSFSFSLAWSWKMFCWVWLPQVYYYNPLTVHNIA